MDSKRYLIKILEAHNREFDEWKKEMRLLYKKVEHRHTNNALLIQNLTNELENGKHEKNIQKGKLDE